MKSPRPANSLREILELAIMLMAAASILLASHQFGSNATPYLIWLVVLGAALKTAYYFAESLWHLLQATASDLAYHRFLILMSYNMAEVTFSFAIDFFLMNRLDPQSIGGIPSHFTWSRSFFECFYFSVLNFSFFGYGDIIPTTVAAKIVMLFEVITAFTTVIFLISDFVSMKDSMRRRL